MVSDRIGRKPPLIFGMMGLAVAVTGFGLSTTFVPLVIFRALQGVFNGNIGITKAVMGEITNPSNTGSGELFKFQGHRICCPYANVFLSSLFNDPFDVGTWCYIGVSATISLFLWL